MAREARVSAGGAAGDGGDGADGREGGDGAGGREGSIGDGADGDMRRGRQSPHPPPQPAPTGEGDGLVLALDAGSPVVSVAVGRGGEVLAAGAVTLQRSSTQLLALVAEVLRAAAAMPADLAGIVALAGPGSFTGLRVGLATALGLVQGLGVRAQAVPTLAALAAASEALPGGLVIAAVDALRGEWSAQAFRAGPVPEPLGEMTLVPAGELLAHLAPGAAAASAPPEIIAFGVSALRRGADAAGGWARFQEAPPLAPAALRLAAALPPASWRAASLAAPIYARPPATTAPKPRPESPPP